MIQIVNRPDPKKRPVVTWFVLRGEKWVQLPKGPTAEDVEVAAPTTRVVATQQSLEGADRGARANAIYLVAKDKSALVTSDGVAPLLDSKMGAVAFVSQNLTIIKRLRTVSKEVYAEEEVKKQREAIQQRAKQAGLGLMMYSMDADDVLPDATDLENKILPYLKDRGILAGFVYTHAGGPTSQITDPANTELGYIPGPGGRAVVMADGSVRWVPG